MLSLNSHNAQTCVCVSVCLVLIQLLFDSGWPAKLLSINFQATRTLSGLLLLTSEDLPNLAFQLASPVFCIGGWILSLHTWEVSNHFNSLWCFQQIHLNMNHVGMLYLRFKSEYLNRELLSICPRV